MHVPGGDGRITAAKGSKEMCIRDREGGVGIISTAQIGYDEEGFENDQAGCNLKAIKKHIRRAKELLSLIHIYCRHVVRNLAYRLIFVERHFL